MSENPIVQEIKELITTQLSPTHLEVIDDSAAHAGHAGAMERPAAGHYHVIVTASDFSGKSTIQRHRMVYNALGELMHERIHALQLTTKSPDE